MAISWDTIEIALIVTPTVLISIIFIAILFLLKSHRAKLRKIAINNSIDDKQLSLSEVRSCIHGGKLVCAPPGGQVFRYRELEVATDGFSEDSVVGKRGSWVVHRGVLGDGTIAAIKVLHKDGKQGERGFRTEIDLLNRLHSRYLVGLIGYCADQHHRILVFEFMSNGSLQHHLHPPGGNHEHQPLSWLTRLRIALDCAHALEFLHEHTSPAVIHRDFKCSNILLDRNYRAKVSDFGMAKTVSNKINGQISARVIGTTGYVAPEYASTGKLTTKSDVYSYGVVLLELLTGRVPIDVRRPSGEHVLVSWALPRLTNREKVEEMVDPALKGQYSKKELIQIAAIAAVCVQSEADYRPLITDVVQSLIPLARRPTGTSPMTPYRSQRQMGTSPMTVMGTSPMAAHRTQHQTGISPMTTTGTSPITAYRTQCHTGTSPMTTTGTSPMAAYRTQCHTGTSPMTTTATSPMAAYKTQCHTGTSPMTASGTSPMAAYRTQYHTGTSPMAAYRTQCHTGTSPMTASGTSLMTAYRTQYHTVTSPISGMDTSLMMAYRSQHHTGTSPMIATGNSPLTSYRYEDHIAIPFT